MLWTAPLGPLAAAVPGAPAVTARHRGVVLVYLVVDEDRYADVDAHYVPDADVAFARLSEPKNYRRGPDPAGTHRAVRRGAGDGRATPPGRRRTTSWPTVILDGMDRVGLRRPAVAEVVVTPAAVRVPGGRGGRGGGPARGVAWADGLDGVTVLGRQGLARRRQPAPRARHGAGRGRVAWTGPAAGTPRGGRPSGARFDGFVVDD